MSYKILSYFRLEAISDPNTMVADQIKELRYQSKYLQIRRTKMPYQGNVQSHKYPIISEEMPMLFLPLIKYALQTNRSLFFIERGGYPQRMAVQLALQKLGLENKIKLYSYKTSTGRTEPLSANEDLARIAYGFIESTFPKQISHLLTQTEIDTHIRPLFDQLSPEIQQKLTQAILKKYPKYQTLFEFIKDRSKAEVLREFIEADPADNVLDDMIETNIVNQHDNPVSVFFRAQHGQTIPFNLDCFGKNPPKNDSERKFRDYLYQNLKSAFLHGIDKNNAMAYRHALQKLQKQYLIQQLPSFQFATIDLLRYLASSYGLNQQPMIYCDDLIGFGTYYFKSILFHKIFGTGEFHYNTTEDCGHNKPGNLLPLGYISNAFNFPEDEPEMFPFYYQKLIDKGKPSLKRIEYLAIAQPLSRKEKRAYAQFLNQMDALISDSPLLEKILTDPIVNQRFSFHRTLKDQLEFKRAVLFYFLDPQDPLIGLMTEYFGHSKLHNHLDYLYPQFQNLAESLKTAYFKIRPIHQKQIVLDMIRFNRYFKNKLSYFSDFFSLHKTKVKAYLHSDYKPKNMNNTFQLADPQFVRLLEDFYSYIDHKKVSYRGQ